MIRQDYILPTASLAARYQFMAKNKPACIILRRRTRANARFARGSFAWSRLEQRCAASFAIQCQTAMRVGIIGTNWGRTHIGTFRRGGGHVQVLVGTDAEATARLAAEEQVPIGTADVDTLEQVDIVVVATPGPSHAQLVERFLHKVVLCERPLVGGVADAELSKQLAGARVWVNYAFPFLATAGRVGAHVLPKRVADIELCVATHLPRIDDALTAWREVAVHPLAFISQLFGPFESAGHEPNGDSFEAVLENTHHRVRARVTAAGRPGIDIDIAMSGPDVRVDVRGGYRPCAGWGFDPIRVDGTEVGPSERSDADRDVWFDANCGVAATVLAVARGQLSPTEAAERGLVSATAALNLERVLVPD